MRNAQKWIIVRIDGKIAGVSTDYRVFAKITKYLATVSHSERGNVRQANEDRTIIYNEVSAIAVGLDEVLKLKEDIKWDDLLLFGTDFQKKVWRKLWDLTHSNSGRSPEKIGGKGNKEDNTKESRKTERLCSYSDFAELCENRAGVRAVAHAIGLNPVSVLIPCHLVVPKESIDRIREIQRKAESTIFKGEDLCLNSILADNAIDFGEYSLGKELKRKLIMHELA